jgi:hypothetical protein
VEFTGRAGEIVRLIAWCEDDSANPMRLITGPGGVGKTRLALRLSELMQELGWRCIRVGDEREAGAIADVRAAWSGRLPPGTGKSQTIANLIASLIARGKKVLFVAEKRAAIDAVTKRLTQQDLGELVLDLHDGVASRRAFAQMIGRALDASRNAPRLDNGADLHRVERRRDQLNGYVHALHGTREPWGMSVYDMRAGLLGLESAGTGVPAPRGGASRVWAARRPGRPPKTSRSTRGWAD